PGRFPSCRRAPERASGQIRRGKGMFHHVNEPPLLQTTRAALRPGEDVLLVGRPYFHFNQFNGKGVVGRVEVACCPWCHETHIWPGPGTTPEPVLLVRMPCQRGPYRDGAVYLGLAGDEAELFRFLSDFYWLESQTPKGRKNRQCQNRL